MSVKKPVSVEVHSLTLTPMQSAWIKFLLLVSVRRLLVNARNLLYSRHNLRSLRVYLKLHRLIR